MRFLIKGIINETNARRVQQQNGFIRDFRDRRAPNFPFIEESITFMIECLYKSFKDSTPPKAVLEEVKEGSVLMAHDPRGDNSVNTQCQQPSLQCASNT